MPERLIREGILESEAVNRISPEAELFYRRVMSIVDDYGRFEWDVKKIRLRVFGYRFDWATEAKIAGWMSECEAELIVLYQVGAKKYFEIRNFGQRLRAKRSKFPGPLDSTVSKENARQVSGKRHTDVGHVRSETESEAESETESEASRECSGSQQGLKLEPSPPPPKPSPNPLEAQKPPHPEPLGAIRESPPRGNSTRKPPESPPIRVETRQVGPNGMHRPARIEIPPGLPPEHIELARTLREVTDGRMSPDVPDADLVRFLLAEAQAAGMPATELPGLVVACVRRQRKSNSRWRPESWGWFRMVLPSRMRARESMPELVRTG